MFLTALRVNKIDSGKYQLKKSLIYDYKGKSIIIPRLFITDVASIPKCFHWLFKPTSSKYSKACILHDYLYSVNNYSKVKDDLIFLHALKDNGCEFTTRWIFFLSVLMFGWAKNKSFREKYLEGWN